MLFNKFHFCVSALITASFCMFALHTFKIIYNNDPRRHEFISIAKIFCYGTSIFIFLIGIVDALLAWLYPYYLLALFLALFIGFTPIFINTIRISRASSLLRVNSTRISTMLRNVKLLVGGTGLVVLSAGIFQIWVAYRVISGLQTINFKEQRTSIGHSVFLGPLADIETKFNLLFQVCSHLP